MVNPAESRSARWHIALALAIAGRRWDDLGRQDAPDPEHLAEQIADRFEGGVDGLRAMIINRRATGLDWPFPVPEDLRAGLGAAQWLAALSAVRHRLGLDRPASTPVLADRPLDAAERRLLADVPPHHGS